MYRATIRVSGAAYPAGHAPDGHRDDRAVITVERTVREPGRARAKNVITSYARFRLNLGPMLDAADSVVTVDAAPEQEEGQTAGGQPSFTLTREDAAEFLADVDPAGDIRIDSVLSLAEANGEQRVTAGKWHLQVDHAGGGAFTITIHSRRTARPAASAP